MYDNEGLYPPSPHGILNVFAAADLWSCSSSVSAKYELVCFKTKVIRSSILSAGECPEECSEHYQLH